MLFLKTDIAFLKLKKNILYELEKNIIEIIENDVNTLE